MKKLHGGKSIVDSFFEKRLEQKKETKKCKNPVHSINNEKNSLNKFLAFAEKRTGESFDETFFAENQERLLEDFFEDLSGSSLTYGTKVTYSTVLKGFINFCVGDPRVADFSERLKNARKLVPIVQKRTCEFNRVVAQQKRERVKGKGFSKDDSSNLSDPRRGTTKVKEPNQIDSDETEADEEEGILVQSSPLNDSVGCEDNFVFVRKMNRETEMESSKEEARTSNEKKLEFGNWEDFFSKCNIAPRNFVRYIELMEKRGKTVNEAFELDGQDLEGFEEAEKLKVKVLISNYAGYRKERSF